jgi:hypothetical protein
MSMRVWVSLPPPPVKRKGETPCLLFTVRLLPILSRHPGDWNRGKSTSPDNLLQYSGTGLDGGIAEHGEKRN